MCITVKKAIQKVLCVLFSACVAFSVGAVPGMAAEAPTVDSVEYKGSGKVEVEFYEDVSYKNTRVTVKDSSGRNYRARILRKDSDDILFRVLGYRGGKKYTFIIHGIKTRGTGVYRSVKGILKIPSATSAARIVIKELEYNNGRLDVEFGHRVQWKKPQVSVKDSGGRTYPARIADRDGDDCEIRVSGLKRGRKYTVRITGIKKRGAGKFTSVAKSFYVK